MIRFALISDIHITTENSRQKRVLENILNHLQNMYKNNQKIDFLVINGDITASGIKDEYDIAHDFLIELHSTLKIPKDNFIFIPGNHDYNRNDIGTAFKHVGKLDTITYEEILSSPDFYKHLQRAFGLFQKFQRKFYGKAPKNITGFSKLWNIRENMINISVINSCQINTIGKDTLTPFVNLDEIKKFKSKLDYDLSIFFMHHPIENLFIPNNRILDNLFQEKADIVVCGHEHYPRIRYIESVNENKYLSIVCGSTYVNQGKEFESNNFGFIILEYNPVTTQITIHPWQTNPNMIHCGSDTTLYPSANVDGIIKYLIDYRMTEKTITDPLENYHLSQNLEINFKQYYREILGAKDSKTLLKIRKKFKSS